MQKLTDAYELFHQGTLALAQVEANGMRIDLDYCKKQCEVLDKKIKTWKI